MLMFMASWLFGSWPFLQIPVSFSLEELVTESSNFLHLQSPSAHQTSGLYYKSFTIVIYYRNGSSQYYKTTITIVIYDLT